jgi:hypothetical protein
MNHFRGSTLDTAPDLFYAHLQFAGRPSNGPRIPSRGRAQARGRTRKGEISLSARVGTVSEGECQK